MTDQKDIYRAAKLFINQHGAEAEKTALGRMQAFMDEEDVVGASAWLMIAQAVKELQQTTPNTTVH